MGNRQSPAFTLVELLMVVGIIAVLMGLLIPAITGALRGGDKARLNAHMQAIATALEAYKTDFGSYPVTSFDAGTSRYPTLPVAGTMDSYDNKINADGLRGARTLAKALVGPAQRVNTAGTNARFDEDGEDNSGFRVADRTGAHPTRDSTGGALTTPRGKVYGPYLTGPFGKVQNTDTAGALLSPTPYDDTAVLVDALGSPVLYFPQITNNLKNINIDNGTNTDGVGGLIGDTSITTLPFIGLFDINDNKLFVNSNAGLATRNLGRLLGDKNNAGTSLTSGHIGPGETAKLPPRPYLLWFAGSDRIFGIGVTTEENNAAVQAKIDDVTNIAP